MCYDRWRQGSECFDGSSSLCYCSIGSDDLTRQDLFEHFYKLNLLGHEVYQVFLHVALALQRLHTHYIVFKASYSSTVHNTIITRFKV